MSLADTIGQDLTSIETDLGSKHFTWTGEDYVCSPAGAGETAILEEGGFAVNIDILLVVRKALFSNSAYPSKNHTIIYNFKTYRINRVVEDSTNTFFRLYCLQENRGV